MKKGSFPPELDSGTPLYRGTLKHDIDGFGKKGDPVEVRESPLAVYRRVGQVNVVNLDGAGILLSTKQEVPSFINVDTLRQATIRLAYQKPSLRPHLLPILVDKA